MAEPNAEAEVDVTERLEAMFQSPQEKEPEEAEPESEDEAPAPEEEEAETESEPEETFVEFEFDGKKVRVPESAKDGFMLREDYTRKTMEAAEIKRSAESERLALQAQRQAEAALGEDLLNMRLLEAQLKKYDEIDLSSLAVNDPSTAVRIQAEKDAIRSKLSAAKDAVNQKSQQVQYIEQMRGQQMLQQAHEAIRKTIPNFTSEEVQTGIGKVLTDAGYSRDDIMAALKDPYSMVNDPKAMTIAHKAFLWDKLQASKPAVTKKAESVTKTLTPKGQTPQGNRDKQASELRDRFKKSKSDDDAIALLLAKGTRRK